MSKIKINSDMESTIVASLMSLVDDRPTEDEEIKKLLKKESGSTLKAQDSDQAPPPPPPPPPPPRSQSTTSLNVREQLQQLRPIVPQSQQDFQNSHSQVLDSQSEWNATMQDFHRQHSHQHLNFDDSDLQFAMSLENQQQQPFQQPFQQQQPMQDYTRMSYDNNSVYYYQHQNQHQLVNPIIKPERPYDANFISPLPSFNTFGTQPTGGKNSINKIIEDLRTMPWSDERMLCFINVFHQFYNGPTIAPNGEFVIVYFQDKIPPLFQRSFIDYTTKGKFIIFYFYFASNIFSHVII